MKGKSSVDERVQKSGVIKFDPDYCIGCQACFLVCPLCHKGVISCDLSRVIWISGSFESLTKGKPAFCDQCDYPECYYSCPVGAIYIDKATGARCIDPETCIGCKECIEACPFDPPRINFDSEREIAIKCDLCGGDPKCVKVCPNNALSYIPKGGR
jgi:Fe-S-cluster-containing hydrogenase components 1